MYWLEWSEGEDKVSRQQQYWIKLYASDRQSITNREWLTDAVINSAQTLLREHAVSTHRWTTDDDSGTYPIIPNREGRIRASTKYKRESFAKMQYLTSGANHIYDSIPYGDVSTRAKQQICALVFSDAAEITQLFKCAVTNRGGSDCGLYMLLLSPCTSLCTGFDPSDLIKVRSKLFSRTP